VVDDATFDALRRFRDDFGLSSRLRSGPAGNFRNHSWGMSDQPDTDGEFFLGDLQNDWRYPAPNGYRVARGAEPHITLVPNRSDLEENLQRVSDARRSADWVVVSMHNHEQGLSIDDPSDVATDVAHAVIDAGADVFHGHGPHRDRGIEIYKGRPIFYSIGHFVFENETVARVPMDNMVRQGLTRWESTPADFYDSRSGAEWSDEWRGHAAHAAGWRDFVAFVRFSAGRLSEVLLQPIDLGFKRPRYMRGRPMIARGQTAVEVVQLMQRLSEPFGTKVELDGEVGRIVL
jgi:poly-gamma-glutamate synthesis protein (capsule biosynthesis protein)